MVGRRGNLRSRACSWLLLLLRRSVVSLCRKSLSLTNKHPQQQEEQEKKAQRLKEMEARRQQAMQRKAEEEKARAAEEERKIKEEAERRKREREEHTDKRPLRNTTTAAKKVCYRLCNCIYSRVLNRRRRVTMTR